MELAVARLRRRAAEAAADHPRHLVVAVMVAGLLLGDRVPASVVVVVGIGVAVAAVTVPLVRGPVSAVALALVLLLAAVGAAARTDALDATRLGPELGRAVWGEATVLTATRPAAFGGHRALARWQGEPVLLRLPPWGSPDAGPIGSIVAVRGVLRAPDRAAQAARAHATLLVRRLSPTGRRRGGMAGWVDGLRRRAQGTLSHGLPLPEAALLQGMVLGHDEALPDDLRQAFQATGLTHLVAASGQNIALLSALALALCMVLDIGIRGRWVAVLALIAVYVPLAGGGPSIQRAGIMGAATVAAGFAGRPASRWYAVLVAAMVTLAIDPRMAGDAGWQLSFAAVLGMLVMAPALRRRITAAGVPDRIAEAVAVTTAATLATAPVIALTFGRTSLVALPANLLAAPAVAPVMWLGLLAIVAGAMLPGVAGLLVHVAGLGLGYLVWLATTLAGLPGAQLAVPAAAVVVVAVVMAVAAVALGRTRHEPVGTRLSGRGGGTRRGPLRVGVGVIAAAAIAGSLLLALGRHRGALPPPPPGDLRVTALDVGQGDATLLQAGADAVLVDAGPVGSPVVPELQAAGVTRLDALVVTHAQADHEGGAPAVLAALPVRVLLDGRDGDRAALSRALDGPLARRHVEVVAARAGERLHAGALTLEVVWPPAAPPVPGEDPNDRAVVAVATAFGGSALLTADAESPVLAPLDLPHVDVLKVSHHGSADAGLPDLLRRLTPRIALIEVGRHNSYGHPTQQTLDELRAAVPVVRRTDRDGVVRVDLERGRATVSTAHSRGGGGV